MDGVQRPASRRWARDLVVVVLAREVDAPHLAELLPLRVFVAVLTNSGLMEHLRVAVGELTDDIDGHDAVAYTLMLVMRTSGRKDFQLQSAMKVCAHV
jgi:hypothetical protein